MTRDEKEMSDLDCSAAAYVKSRTMSSSRSVDTLSGTIHVVLPFLRKRVFRPSADRHASCFCFLVSRRALRAGMWLTCILFLSALAGLMCGNLMISPFRVIEALFHGGEPADLFLINELRLPRISAAIASGAGFALAGCLMQTLTRNRLAVPDVIGIGQAATLGAVFAIAFFPSGVEATWWAMIAAFGIVVLTFLLAGGISQGGFGFAVIGVGIGALCHALTTLLLARNSLEFANTTASWTTGSLGNTSQAALIRMWVALALCLPVSFWLGFRLRTLYFADTLIRAWGIRLSVIRLALLLQAVICASLAIALAGPVAMIGLMGPEIARAITGRHSVPFINAMLAGATLMVIADTLGRTIFGDIEIPVGIITALLGGPCLLWILFRYSEKGGSL
ncbi:Vitamin B12 import system permease protein BtuC [Halomonadaceae bacterium LMG 33818]|uniref:FecCD family ABC transporter permease n=1 Tax=Cernens ardua TaxID=3402176 RepID=UPI003EDC40C8